MGEMKMAKIVRMCPSPKCETELVEKEGPQGWVMYCPKCGGSKIYWQRKEVGGDE